MADRPPHMPASWLLDPHESWRGGDYIMIPIRRRQTYIGAGLTALLLAITMLLAGCQNTPAPPVTVVVTASAAEPAPSSAPIVAMLKARALHAQAPTAGAVDIVVAGRPDIVTIDLTPMRKQEVEVVPERADKLVDAHADELAAALAGMGAGSDELNLLDAYDRGLRHTPDGGTVVVLSSAIQTVDPLDLRSLGWSFDPQAVVADLQRRHAIPDAHGRHVQMFGIGIALNTQPPLPQPQRELLQQLWRQICIAGGAATCEVTDTDVPLSIPTSTRPVSVVPVPPLSTTESACRTTALSIPDAVLFDADSAVLRPGADAVLARIAAQLTGCPHGSRITITGHAADVNPGQVDGQDISDRRAEVCRDRLVAFGVPAEVFAAVHGVADTQPRVADIVDGVFTESLAAPNRRVDIAVENP